MKTKITVLALLMAVTPHTRATINRAFRPDDFEILWMASPSEAVEASAKHRPGLLLLDLNQPLHKGWATFENLRKAHPYAPALVLSEDHSIYDLAVANRKGAVLHKPVGVATLLETVDMLMNKESLGTGLKGSHNDDSCEAVIRAERFRAEILKRYNAPYALPTPYGHWGINE